MASREVGLVGGDGDGFRLGFLRTGQADFKNPPVEVRGDGIFLDFEGQQNRPREAATGAFLAVADDSFNLRIRILRHTHDGQLAFRESDFQIGGIHTGNLGGEQCLLGIAEQIDKRIAGRRVPDGHCFKKPVHLAMEIPETLEGIEWIQGHGG